MAANFEIDKNVFVYNQQNSIPNKVIKNLKFMIFPELYVALMMSSFLLQSHIASLDW